MVQAKPVVTVLMATRNGSRFIHKALDSVAKQTYRNFEVVIIDDASTDGVDSLIQGRRDLPIRYLRNKGQRRLSASLNRGITEARGDLVARIDDDDVWESETKLEQQVELMLSNPRLGMCGTHNIVIDEQGHELYRLHFPLLDQDIKRTLLSRNPFPHSGVVVRRDALLAAGGYHEQLFYAQDYHLWLKIGLNWGMANLPDQYIKQRIVMSSLSNAHNFKQWQEFMWAAYTFRHHYPGFVKDLPLYGREFVINLFPKTVFFRLRKLKPQRATATQRGMHTPGRGQMF
jgi:glycosyltransferase involved in cell wall biosynthesis